MAPIAAAAAALLLVCTGQTLAANPKPGPRQGVQTEASVAKPANGEAEARLIEIYQLIAKSQNRDALDKAGGLVRDLPNFQLAQLVYGDLLLGQTRPVKTMGDVPEALAKAGKSNLDELREESRRRIKALRERPVPGTIPSQFLALSGRSKHAIAVDTSRSRLYLFENTPSGLNLLADYYISVGKAGTAKVSEGDQRTPLGVYYVNSNLDRKTLKDFYGSGALPINYPNVLDTKRGRTGSGIWLHGTPPDQFSRPPQATDGCVVLANPDLDQIIRTVEVRSTPVVIAEQLKWVPSHSIRAEGRHFEEALFAWRNAKTAGDIGQILSFYTEDFNSNGKNLAQWTPSLKSELTETRGRTIQLKDVSYLRWTDTAETMVVTFGEVADGDRVGRTKRQYWIRQNNRWKIFFEGQM
ncbi:MAG: L,D-transpeptidase family protein [Rhodoferax sp.]|nr:L,D-transpeptidase family protein [Rhodoferax sp.]